MHIRDGEQILEMMRAYQVPCLLAAAADLSEACDGSEYLMQASRAFERRATARLASVR